jgi:hypothetical protein
MLSRENSDSEDSLDYLLYDSDTESSPEIKASTSRNIKSHLKQIGLTVVPLITTTSDTSIICFSINDIKDNTLAYHIKLNGTRFEVMKILIPSLYGLSSITLNTHWVIRGMKIGYKLLTHPAHPDNWPQLTRQEMSNVINNHTLPSDWPELNSLSHEEQADIINQLQAEKLRTDYLTLNKKKRVLLAGVLVSSAVIDAINTFYYLDYLFDNNLDEDNNHHPYYKIISILAAIIYGWTNIFSEGIETIQTIANKETTEYFSPVSKYTTIAFNCTASIIGSLTTAIEESFPLMIIFGVTTPAGQALALSWVTTKFITDYCLGSANCYESFDGFMKNFFATDPADEHKRPFSERLVKIGIFGASFYSAALLADLQRAFFIQLMREPLSASAVLPFEMPEWLIEVFGRGRSIRDLVVNTHFLTPFFEGCFNVLTYVPKKIIHSLSQRCKKNRIKQEEYEPISTCKLSTHRNSMFKRPSELKECVIDKSVNTQDSKDENAFPKKSSCVLL